MVQKRKRKNNSNYFKLSEERLNSGMTLDAKSVKGSYNNEFVFSSSVNGLDSFTYPSMIIRITPVNKTIFAKPKTAPRILLIGFNKARLIAFSKIFPKKKIRTTTAMKTIEKAIRLT